MKKSFLGINVSLTICLLSMISIFFTFVSKCGGNSSVISFIITVIQSFIFIVIPYVFYIMEKNDLKLKNIAGIYTSYFVINFIVIVLSSLNVIDNFIPFMLRLVFDLINLLILLTGVFVFIEQVLIYSSINNNFYKNIVMGLVYKIGENVSYPILRFINKKSGKR